MEEPGKIFVAKSGKPEYLTLAFGNRHGLVTGATGTGKTVTLQVLAEGFSAAGVPVFAADIKGDLSGISQPGEGQGLHREARRRDRARLPARPVPGALLGHLRRAGRTGPHDHLRDGAAAAGDGSSPQRRSGRRPQHRLQARRRPGPPPPRHEGPAGRSWRPWPNRRTSSSSPTATYPRRRSAPSSASSSCSSSRAATSSSPSRRSRSPT